MTLEYLWLDLMRRFGGKGETQVRKAKLRIGIEGEKTILKNMIVVIVVGD